MAGHQAFPEDGDWSLYLSGDMPQSTTWFSLTGDGIPLGRRLLRVSAGDFLLEPMRSTSQFRRPTDPTPLFGAALEIHSSHSRWNLFAGQSRYPLRLPVIGLSEASAAGAEFVTERFDSLFGLGVTFVQDAPMITPTRTSRSHAVFSTRFDKALSPWKTVFGEGYATSGGFGGRAGAAVRGRNGDLTGSFFHFDAAFPLLYPLYRPAETGLDLRGLYRFTPRSSLYAALTWSDDDLLRDRREVRGHAGLGFGFGSNRPHLSIDYSREDILYETLTPEQDAVIGDRLAIAVQQASNFGFFDARLEHARSTNVGLDRSQAQILLRRVIGLDAFLEAAVVAQRDEAGSTGFTAEAAVELPVTGPWSVLTGLGVAALERLDDTQGEGVLRLGVSRRFTGSGWYARLETRLPFSIGMERSDLNRGYLAIDFGNRYNWRSLDTMGAAFRRGPRREGRAVLEGYVRVDDQGRRGVRVLVDGEPRAYTDANGFFRITGLADGHAEVGVDLRSLPPGYEVSGASTRSVPVGGGDAARADFEIARFATLQAAILTCDGSRFLPVAGATVALDSGEAPLETRTNHVGSFAFDGLTGGTWRLIVTSADGAPLAHLGVRVEAGEDIRGVIIRIGCDGVAVESGDPRLTPIAPPPAAPPLP